MSMEQKDGKNRLPEFYWLTKEEVIARQKTERPRQGGSGHSDPTADEAIARAYFWEMAKMKEEHDNDRSKKERTVRSDTDGEAADSASAETKKGKKAKIQRRNQRG